MVQYTKTARPIWTKHLREKGNETNFQITGDYSLSPTFFQIGPPNNEVWVVNRIILKIQDDAGFRAEGYAANASPLTNGISFERGVDGVDEPIDDFTDGDPIASNGCWAHFCYDVSYNSWGAGDNFLSARWTLDRHGFGAILDGNKNEVFRARVSDNFTGIVEHLIVAEGFIDRDVLGIGGSRF